MSNSVKRQKVFGLGLSKTGTSSLSAALNILGVKTIHFPNDEQTFHELTSGTYRLSVLDEYDGACDTPIAPYYAQLDKIYPGSKFILTVREKNSWLKSAEYHWQTITERKRMSGNLDNFSHFIHAVVYGSVDFNPERFSYVYDTHERNVRDYFKERPDDLLILDICGGDGWEKLCGFLGLEIPQVPFPLENRKKPSPDHVAADIDGLVAPGETYVLVDGHLLWEREPAGRHPIRMVEHDGQYWGLPPDDDTAIREVEQLRQAGAKRIVFAWPAFWWLDYYAGFRRYLESQNACSLRNERVIVFDLPKDRAAS